MKHIMHKAALALVCGILMLTGMPASKAEGVGTHARASSLIDVASGRILYSSQGDQELPIASLTKIMTAIVAIEHGRLGDTVKVSSRASGKEGSSLYLKPGEEMKLHDMLYGLMLRSGNDAATAIAEHVGGSEEGFVYLMNAKVEELGLKHTHFANPHGLDAEGHYSSANDLAKMTAYALRNPVFKEIVKTNEKQVDNPNEPWDYKWRNKNKMLRLYEGADGVKTGYTKKAFRCLVSSATRGGQQLAAVTLDDGDDWNDHMSLLDFGFARFPLKPVIERGERVSGHELAAASDFVYPFGKGEYEQLTKRLVLYSNRNSSSSSSSSSSISSSSSSSSSSNSRTKAAPPGGEALGPKGVIVLMLGEQEIGRVPVYPPDRLPPEPAEYGQSLQSASRPQAPASLFEAWIRTIRALFERSAS